MRKYIKIGLLLLGLIACYQLYSARVLLYPQSKFSHHTKYRQFDIYADFELTDTYLQLFDEVSNRLQFIPIYTSNNTFTVFLCIDRNLYGEIIEEVKRPVTTQGFHLQPMDYTFINLSYIKEIKTQYGADYGKGILEGNPAHVITHELTHQLMAEKIGFMTDRKLKSWIKEGYCEYTSSVLFQDDSITDLKVEIKKYQSDFYKEISEGRKLYIRSRLIIWYLFKVKNYDFEELISATQTEQELWAELINWIKQEKDSFR